MDVLNEPNEHYLALVASHRDLKEGLSSLESRVDIDGCKMVAREHSHYIRLYEIHHGTDQMSLMERDYLEGAILRISETNSPDESRSIYN